MELPEDFENGLQRNILHIASKEPFKAPYFSNASIAYCEQVGVYIQWVRTLRGDKYFW